MIAFLSEKSKRFIVTAGIALVLIIGVLDFLSGTEIGFSFFYLVPIYLVTWFSGRIAGILMSLASVFIWFTIAELIPAGSFPDAFSSYWQAIVRLVFFIVIVLLETRLKDARSSALTDPLTSVGNRRYFFEYADIEIRRLRRYKRPFSAAFIDIDNFKKINDKFGHGTGDRLLESVAKTVKDNIRFTDIFARLGGDEFVLLLIETDQETAQKYFTKLFEKLMELMKRNKWPVTFSMGIVTFVEPPESVNDMVGKIDSVMYSVKKKGGNSLGYETWGSD